jgi:GTP cyclohydrolase I
MSDMAASYAEEVSADVQNSPDDRNIRIDQVGVSELRYPIAVFDRTKKRQHTVATLSLSVDLPHQFKGTHMSRFVEVLNKHRGEIATTTLPEILADLRRRLHAECAHLEVVFPYFMEKAAPQTGAIGMMDYECSFTSSLGADAFDLVVSVRVPVASLCPCSKAISDYGAHNQRGFITLRVRPVGANERKPVLIWLEELIDLAERSASAPVYALLKRQDERHVTMQAYDNPVFVEDMVRNAARLLMDDPRVAWFEAHAENHESIHNHNAFARVEWTRDSESS